VGVGEETMERGRSAERTTTEREWSGESGTDNFKFLDNKHFAV